MTDDDGINVKLRSWASVKPALLAVISPVEPADAPEPPAPFWALCKSLQKRQKQLAPEFYLGAVDHLVEKFYAMPGNGSGGSLHVVLDDGNTDRESVEWCHTYAREHGDKDGMALCDLLLTLSDEQRGRAL